MKLTYLVIFLFSQYLAAQQSSLLLAEKKERNEHVCDKSLCMGLISPQALRTLIDTEYSGKKHTRQRRLLIGHALEKMSMQVQDIAWGLQKSHNPLIDALGLDDANYVDYVLRHGGNANMSYCAQWPVLFLAHSVACASLLRCYGAKMIDDLHAPICFGLLGQNLLEHAAHRSSVDSMPELVVYYLNYIDPNQEKSNAQTCLNGTIDHENLGNFNIHAQKISTLMRYGAVLGKTSHAWFIKEWLSLASNAKNIEKINSLINYRELLKYEHAKQMHDASIAQQALSDLPLLKDILGLVHGYDGNRVLLALDQRSYASLENTSPEDKKTMESISCIRFLFK